MCLCGQVLDVLGELFSGGPLSLRADSSGRPKLPGSDSRLNLVHLFAASCCYGFSRAPGLRLWLLYLSCFRNLIECVFRFFFLFLCFVFSSVILSKTKKLGNNILTFLPKKKNFSYGGRKYDGGSQVPLLFLCL